MAQLIPLAKEHLSAISEGDSILFAQRFVNNRGNLHVPASKQDSLLTEDMEEVRQKRLKDVIHNPFNDGYWELKGTYRRPTKFHWIAACHAWSPTPEDFKKYVYFLTESSNMAAVL